MSIGSVLMQCAGAGVTQTHERRSVVYAPGAGFTGRAFVVLDGFVRLKRGATLIDLLGKGDVFGELPGFGTAPDYIAHASTDVELLVLSTDVMQVQFSTRPQLAYEVAMAYGQRVAELQYPPVVDEKVPQRIARVLLELDARHGQPCGHGYEHEVVGLSQTDLGNLVGSSRAFVSTVVNEMRRQGALAGDPRSHHRRFCLQNRATLRLIAAGETRIAA